jgi:hypothetical protein
LTQEKNWTGCSLFFNNIGLFMLRHRNRHIKLESLRTWNLQ